MQNIAKRNRLLTVGCPCPLPYLPPNHPHQYRHQRGDDVEEAEGGVGEGGDGEDRGLGHAAAGPGEEGRGDGGGVFHAAAEEAAFVAVFLVGVPVDVGGEDNGKILVGHDAVERDAGGDRRAYQSAAGAGQGEEDAGKVLDHPACPHAGAEAHRAQDEVDGVEHADHPSSRNKLIDSGIAGIERNSVIHRLHRAGKEKPGPGTLGHTGTDAPDDVRLEHEGRNRRRKHRQRQDDYRRQLLQYQEDGECGHQQQPRRDVERRLQNGRIRFHLSGRRAAVRESQYRKDYQRDDHRRDGRIVHIMDVLEQADPVDRRCQHGGVRQGRYLVAEVGAGDDGTGRHGVRKALRPSDSQQRDADGSDRRPGRPRHQRHNRAKHARGQQEHLRVDDLDAVGDERRHNAAHRPGAGDGADQEQYQDCLRHLPEVGGHRLLELLPGRLVQQQGDCQAHPRRRQQRHLRRPQYRIRPPDGNERRLQRNQHSQRNQSQKHSSGGRFHGAKVKRIFVYGRF